MFGLVAVAPKYHLIGGRVMLALEKLVCSQLESSQPESDPGLLPPVSNRYSDEEENNHERIVTPACIISKSGFDEFIANLDSIPWEDILTESGLAREQSPEGLVNEKYIRRNRKFAKDRAVDGEDKLRYHISADLSFRDNWYTDDIGFYVIQPTKKLFRSLILW